VKKVSFKCKRKQGDCIGRVIILELTDQNNGIFEEILALLQQYPDLKKFEISSDSIISIPGLKIYLDRRKIYHNRCEIRLTPKEFDLLCLLVANKGRVLTYEQIYQNVWGEEPMGNENNAVGCHIRNLREKLYEASPEAPFTIRCVREVGYTFEIAEGNDEA